MRRSIALSLLLAALAGRALAGGPDLTTEAERSGWQRTGRYEEVLRLADAFAAAYPGQARRLDFGTTPEGRTMVALVASADGALDPASARAKGRPVILFQGGIHAGEIDGKDAGFLALREMLEGRAAPGALTRTTALFVPVFNVDGHERFGPHNRPNQVGPAEQGWRTTAQNLNLNRDYMKAEAPEMQAMLRLLGAWEPAVYMDLHVTDGADFQPDIAVIGDGDVVRRLRAKGHLALDFYPSFEREDDPLSGFARAPFAPRFSNAYWDLRGGAGVLVETHSWKDYAARVRATRDAIVSAFEAAPPERDEPTSIAGADVPLTYENTEHEVTIDFPGYHVTREPSAVSGAVRVSYDRSKPEVFKVPLRDEVRPALAVRAPKAGYVVEAAHAARVAEKLRLHDVTFTALAEPRRALEVEVFRATGVTLAASTFEGRTMCAVAGEWKRERRDLPAGSLFVPIGPPQRHPRLVLHLLEPRAPDSLVAWGFFNACFEKKEYMEAYVAEDVARAMLEKDPALRAEFMKRLADDPAFARSPEARLDFFYRRHPSFDEKLDLVPIYRVDDAP
jgi:hypothetical protein